jgi:hypothetical protein
METLRHAYPYIREEDLQNALKYAEEKVEVALEILSWATSASVTSKSSNPTTRKAYLGFRVRTRAQPQEQEADLKGKDSESVVAAESSTIIQRPEVSLDTRNDAKPRPVDTKPDGSQESTDIEEGSPETIEWY